MTVHFNDIPDQVGLTRGPQRADAIVRGRLYRKFFKRLIDAAFVLVTLPISVPIMLIFGLLVALEHFRFSLVHIRMLRRSLHIPVLRTVRGFRRHLSTRCQRFSRPISSCVL